MTGFAPSRLLPLLLAAAFAALAVPTSASALSLGFGDGIFANPDQSLRSEWIDRSVKAGASWARVNVRWRRVARNRPASPSDPADPAYDFTAVDEAVTSAATGGLRVLLTVYQAPDWAEGAGRDGKAPAGTWRPDPDQYRMFAAALARRYSGDFAGLPKVSHFQAWNEPNLDVYLTPQWSGGRLVGPAIYRGLLNGMHAGVKSVDPSDVVVTGGTSPYGDPRGGARARPVEFLRSLFCLDKKLRAVRCPEKARFDIVAHHPISTSGGPLRSALDRGDASTPDLGRIVRVVRAAEARHTILPARRHPLWVTEFWWKSSPPDRFNGVAPAKQARWIEQSLYLFWKAGVRVAFNMLIRDNPVTTNETRNVGGSGVYYIDGRPKPALTAIRFPFVVTRLSAKRQLAWGRSPGSGRIRIQRRTGRGWKSVAVVKARRHGAFKRRFRSRKTRRAQRYRAVLAGHSSLIWRSR